MKFQYDHDLHIHSQLSSCSSDPLQSKERILEYAKRRGLHTICLTDHFWDEKVPGCSNWYAPQNFCWISQVKPLPQEEGIRFLFGCETEMDQFMRLGVSKERMDEFDFIIIPTTHLHMTGFTLSEKDAASLERRAELWVERFDAVLSMDLPFHKVGIAHLTCSLLAPLQEEDHVKVLEMISSEEMKRLFTKAAELSVGIELNLAFNMNNQESILRPYRIAKECGCKFYLGTDAHHPSHFEKAEGYLKKAVELLELDEADKFQLLNSEKGIN